MRHYKSMYKSFQTYSLSTAAYYCAKLKDFAHITHFIHNLHDQKLQHYVLHKNPNSVQNAITLAQKKDAELHIITGVHNDDPEHKLTISLTNSIRITLVIQNPAMVAVAHI